MTVVSGKKRRIQFMEVGNDLNDMVDAAKRAGPERLGPADGGSAPLRRAGRSTHH